MLIYERINKCIRVCVCARTAHRMRVEMVQLDLDKQPFWLRIHVSITCQFYSAYHVLLSTANVSDYTNSIEFNHGNYVPVDGMTEGKS